LEWQKASGTRKLDLEEQLNNIKSAEQREMESFHTRSLDIQTQANELQRKRDDEVSRHNKELEAIQERSRQDQANRWQNQSNIEWFNASTQRTKVKNDWNIAMDTNNIRNYEYNLSKSMFEYDQERNKLLDELNKRRTTSGDVLNYASAFSQVSHGLLNFANIGGSYGKKKTSQQVTRTARQIAESYLFGD
jgi:vacuolar-type H+-ATPase subunit I/STV1